MKYEKIKAEREFFKTMISFIILRYAVISSAFR